MSVFHKNYVPCAAFRNFVTSFYFDAENFVEIYFYKSQVQSFPVIIRYRWL